MPETARVDRLEDKVSSLEIATAHGFGEIRQDLAHLREILTATIDRPPPPTPTWVMLLSSGTFLVGLASLLLAVTQLGA